MLLMSSSQRIDHNDTLRLQYFLLEHKPAAELMPSCGGSSGDNLRLHHAKCRLGRGRPVNHLTGADSVVCSLTGGGAAPSPRKEDGESLYCSLLV
ncbi:hypothetical protein E2C01_057745 [Portunus trituberculatus]|uniref:Uncharacterized protein n=1 Tax=Portunus trituberculatus TaxID=210409 RepID=A0A5B7H478_PORTR|nr:hypothetical protein [Portunus trituberculatus]